MFKTIQSLVEPQTVPLGFTSSVQIDPDDPPDFDVLVIEADSPGLERDGISIAATVRKVGLAAGQSVAVVRGGTKQEFLRDLGALAGATARFVVLVGHSHDEGIGLGSGDDHATSWDVVAQWLAPFEPETIFVIGCRSGTSRLSRPLFSSIASLYDVYASPVKTAPTQAVGVLIAVAAAHLDERPEIEQGLGVLGNTVSFLMLRELLRRFTWESWLDDDSPEGFVDAVEQGVSEVLETVREDWKADRRARPRRPRRHR